MNDTVVIYDRIRENLSKHRGRTFWDVINLSVARPSPARSSPPARRCSACSPFFIWGTGVIKDFALAMVVGIIAGTYSSIYVAAPITEWIDERMTKKATKTKRAQQRARKDVAVPSEAASKA